MNFILKLGIVIFVGPLLLAQTGCSSNCQDCCSDPPFDAPIVVTRDVGVNQAGRPEIGVGSSVSTCQLYPNGRTALVWSAQNSVDVGEDSGDLTDTQQPISPIHFDAFDLTVTESHDGATKTYTFASGANEVIVTCSASETDAACGFSR